ncbi:hypothetical protein [Desulfofundulus sp.]|uniref:hypothetical protein n=1 Tax=Desulfofundulus sp. TaxID=2282750 RepID=UPI003C777F95
MDEWQILQTGGHVYVSVKDMKLKGSDTKFAVGVADDSVCIYDAPYDEKWTFFDKEAKCWPICTAEDVRNFLIQSKEFFTPEQQEDILRQRDRMNEI